jgi:hypothetical protein
MTSVRPGRLPAGGQVDLVVLLRPRVAAVLEQVTADETTGAWALAVRRAVAEVLEGYAHEQLAAGRAPLAEPVEARLRQALVHSFLGAGGLQTLLDDDQVETINVNGCDNVWVHRRDGTRMRVAPVAASDDDLAALLHRSSAVRRQNRGAAKTFTQVSGLPISPDCENL